MTLGSSKHSKGDDGEDRDKGSEREAKLSLYELGRWVRRKPLSFPLRSRSACHFHILHTRPHLPAADLALIYFKTCFQPYSDRGYVEGSQSPVSASAQFL